MLKVLYIPTLSKTVGFWRIESYAEEMLNFPDEVAVHIMFMPGTDQNLAWDKLCVGYEDTSKEIQEFLRGMFRTYDVLIFQKIQHKEGVALLTKYREEYPEVTVLAEVDDVIGFIGPSNPHIHKFRALYQWSAEHCSIADGIITSTEALKKDMTKLNENIYVAPNCIAPQRWTPKLQKNKTQKFRIGYVGAGAHDEDLIIAYKGLKPLLDANTGLSWTIRYGGYRPQWLKHHPRIDFKSVSWNLSEYPQRLADLKLDLAVAPLRDTYFNRCKSNLKWIEWSSLGIPLVASDVEPYSNTKGSIHLVSNDPKEWTDYIGVLIKEKKLLNNSDVILLNECFTNYNINTETKNLIEWIKKLRKSKNLV